MSQAPSTISSNQFWTKRNCLVEVVARKVEGWRWKVEGVSVRLSF